MFFFLLVLCKISSLHKGEPSLFIFFASPKKTNQKKGDFYEVFFTLFYRTPKNRFQSAKFSPSLPVGRQGFKNSLRTFQSTLT